MRAANDAKSLQNFACQLQVVCASPASFFERVKMSFDSYLGIFRVAYGYRVEVGGGAGRPKNCTFTKPGFKQVSQMTHTKKHICLVSISG